MKPKKLLKITLLIAIGVPATALGLCYALLSNESFVKTTLLPRISAASGLNISANKISIKPLSEITLEGLSIIDDPGLGSKAPLAIKADSLKLHYNPWALFAGTLEVTKLTTKGLQTTINAEPSAKPETKEARPPSDNSANNDKQPIFTIKLADVAFSNGSFRYIDSQSGSEYLLNAITLDIPKADSNGESEIRLKTSVTIKSAALNLYEEPLSGSLTLHDAALFMPRNVNVSAQAGKLQPTPIEISGRLNFSESRDSLNSIDISKALIRQTLPATLGVAAGPFKEFEYEVKGTYPLSTSTAFDLALSVNRAIAPSSSDLKGSSIKTRMTLKSDSVAVDKADISLISNGATIAKSDLSASVAFNPYSAPSNISIHASEIDFDAISALFSAPSNTTQTPPTESAPDSKGESQQAPQTAPSKLPLLDASLKIDRSVFQKLNISGITADLKIPTSRTINTAKLAATFEGAGNLSANLSGNLDSDLKFRANAEKINVLPLAALMQRRADGSSELLEGMIDLLDIDISLAPNTPRQTLSGRSRLQISRFIVPSTLQGQVPFNILFLPFDALITVFGGTINAILPKSVSSISDGIRQVLDDAGRLGIEKGTIDLDFNQGKINCKKVEIDTKNLPDFTVKGSVAANDRLDFTIFIGLLKLNLPLPVAGTLSTPLPDLVYLGPEIVRGLGLSIGNIAGGVVSLVGGAGAEGAEESKKGK